MSWQINGKFILVPKNQTPSPTGTPTPTPSITDTPTPTPTITNTPSPTTTNAPLYDVLLMEDGFNLLQEDNDKIIL
jgi:hypothetical protein